MGRKNSNPGFVTINACETRHTEIGAKIDEILKILRGNPGNDPDSMGLLGDIRDMKRDRKWIYALLTIIGIPTLFLLVQYVMSGG